MRLAPLISPLAKLDEPLAHYRIHSANTYTRSGMTPETVTREIAMGEVLWTAQREFLRQIAPDVANRLRPVQESPYFHLLKYLQARLRGDAGRKQYYSAFVDGLRGQGNAKQLLFWRLAERMPRPLFAFAVNLLMGPSALKRALVRLKPRNRHAN
jgi:hypothetical protein